MDLTRGARGRGSWGSLKRLGSKLRKLGPVLSGGAFLCRDYPQATESYWLVSLDAERHIDDLTKIAATMHQGAPLERSASAGTFP